MPPVLPDAPVEGAYCDDIPASDVVISADDAVARVPSRDELRIGLVVPQSGVLGLTGPAAIASAVLAAEEVSQRSSTRVTLVPIDSGAAPDLIVGRVLRLTSTASFHTVCGFHTSDVLRRLERPVGGTLPYLFTPPHEGGRHEAGVAVMGPSPREQLLPVMEHLGSKRALRRWALIGSDYIWPRRVHSAASELIADAGARVVAYILVPFSTVDAERLSIRCGARGRRRY